MQFPRKIFFNSKAILISEKPLYATYLEERIVGLLPAMEVFFDSFDTYLSAHSHCSEQRNVGMFYLHLGKDSSMPENAIDELAAPFEAIGSKSGLVIIAEDEKFFAQAYKTYAESPRLLSIFLENEATEDSKLKEKIIESWNKFENLQKNVAVSQDEMDFFSGISAKFEDISLIRRLTHIITAKLDKNWFDDLLIEAGPSILSLPEQQKWILNNSLSLKKLDQVLEPFKKTGVIELLNLKDNNIVAQATVIAYKIYLKSKENVFENFINEITSNTSSFSPTLKKIIFKEKLNILDLFTPKEKKAYL